MRERSGQAKNQGKKVMGTMRETRGEVVVKHTKPLTSKSQAKVVCRSRT
jgi:hypothetical protein